MMSRELMPSGFDLASGNGFRVTFANGVTVSVQFGTSNYCNNRKFYGKTDSSAAAKDGCANAECAVWDRAGDWLHPPMFVDSEDVQGWMTPEQVAALLSWAAAQ